MTQTTTALAPGFVQPVADSQAVFRRVLDALSRPGSVQAMPCLPPAPQPLSASCGAVLLALADADTPLWLAPSLDSTAVRAWLTFHCGCPWAMTPAEAAFAVFSPLDPLPPLDSFDLGSPEMPQSSTTVLLQNADLADAPQGTWSLRGPGIASTTPFPAIALAERLEELWKDNGTLYPQGIDLLLLGTDTLSGLSRTTQLVRP